MNYEQAKTTGPMMPPGMAAQYPGGTLGRGTDAISVTQATQMVWNQSENVVSQLAMILGRLDMHPMGKGDNGATPEMAITQKLSRTFENLTTAEQLINQIATKIFG